MEVNPTVIHPDYKSEPCAVLIHASQRADDVTSEEIERRFSVRPPSVLPLGGIVGDTEIVDCVKNHPSKWFVGDYGFVLAYSRPLPFVQWKGQLGIRDAPRALLDLLDSDIRGLDDEVIRVRRAG